MRPPAARVRDPERTRDVVLDAAAHEFWLHGLEGTRIQLILDRAGTTKGGLYHHFTSKQEIAEALADQQSGRWQQLIDDVSASGRGLEAIGRFLAGAAAHAEAEVRARAVLRIAGELPQPRHAAGVGAWRDFAIRALQQAIADGEVSDAIDIRAAALAVVDALFGVIVLPAEHETAGSAAGRAAALWALLEPGLRATAR
ncbi:TetR/AcrR family transcriptional regulator [Microbacterium album]|uniref:HTH tetR-type domain-containing protein n=1 Tax=Microbacterium album TaxID=2053191 RepID=A0A917IH90_9MICO|nr:TetR/AcrR family transcriptional regulator [Microbacterium album]GGH51274.1 hypothetical protein GCM10010921_30600 [Microbacterium album]